MRIHLLPLLFIVQLNLPAQQKLSDDVTLSFGASSAEVQSATGFRTQDDDQILARPGLDKKISANNLTLYFDSDRLQRFEWLVRLPDTLTPFSDSWQNFPSFGATRLRIGMSRAEFLQYLRLWEARARSLHAEQASGFLQEHQYRIRDSEEVVSVAFGPSRRTSKGGIWNDGWVAIFTGELDAATDGSPMGVLKQLSAHCDRYNSRGRQAANKAPEPTPRPVTIPAEPGIAPGRSVAHL